MNNGYRVVAIPTSVAREVRETMRSPGYGHPASSEVAASDGPCRHCLRTFEPGRDRRILFTYDAFSGTETLPLPGPIFVHERECARYDENRGFPQELKARPLTFSAYAHGRRLVEKAYPANGELDAALERLLARADVDYVHVRDTEAGCYDFRIERAGAES